MLPSVLLPISDLVRFESLDQEEDHFLLHLRTKSSFDHCPACGKKSYHRHSSYVRNFLDLPWAGIPVRVNLCVNKYYCRNEDCHRKIFAERLGENLKPYARRTARLTEHLTQIGYVLGGNAGSKLARFIGMPISSSTMLRVIYHINDEVPISTPRVLGVDDWAFRRGNNYGTILVDLEKGKPIDLLSDREADTLAEWLKQHPGIEIISRDRATFYKDGATRGAPQAIQVADRWHIIKNIRQMLQKIFEANRRALTQAAQELETQEKEKAAEQTQQVNGQIALAESSTGDPSWEKPEDRPKTQRQINYEKVKQLRAQKMNKSAIARKLGIDRRTVAKYIDAEVFPELSPRRSYFTPYMTFISKRLEAGLKFMDLYKEVVGQGYKGAYRAFCYSMKQHFPKHESRIQKPKPDFLKQYTPLRISYLMIKPKDKHPEEFKSFCKLLFDISPSVKKATKLSWKFCLMIRNRKAEKFDKWLTKAEKSGITQLVNFAAGIRKDYDAIKNACTLQWSNGQVEGQVNRLKNIKRQMYGKASFKLLRKRILMDSN